MSRFQKIEINHTVRAHTYFTHSNCFVKKYFVFCAIQKRDTEKRNFEGEMELFFLFHSHNFLFFCSWEYKKKSLEISIKHVYIFNRFFQTQF